jgi:hypothetical protein
MRWLEVAEHSCSLVFKERVAKLQLEIKIKDEEVEMARKRDLKRENKN